MGVFKMFKNRDFHTFHIKTVASAIALIEVLNPCICTATTTQQAQKESACAEEQLNPDDNVKTRLEGEVRHTHTIMVPLDGENKKPETEGKGQEEAKQKNPSPSENVFSYPRISHLERLILGCDCPDEAIAKRIDRLEVEAFGQIGKSKDLSFRTDQLEKYVRENLNALTLNDENKQRELEEAEQAMNVPGKRRISKKVIIAAVIITLVLGVAVMSGGMGAGPAAAMGAGGMGAMGAVGGMGAMGGAGGMGAAGMSAMGAGMGGMGMGGLMGGMGSSQLLMMGMGGMQLASMAKRRPGFLGGKKPVDKDNDSNDAERLNENSSRDKGETKSLKRPRTPKINDTLIEKVRWCEIQLFGETFESLTMVERLSQLNKQLIGEQPSGIKFQTSVNGVLSQLTDMESGKGK